MKNILKVVFVIIGSLIGAGFASGQEIYIFFFSYGLKGLLGIICTSIFIGLTIFKALRIIKEKNIESYKEFIDIIISKSKNKKNLKIAKIINLVINTFILVTFFIMIAGFGAYFEQEFGISSIVGSSILAFLCFMVFTTNVEGLVKVNEILIPILILFIIIIGVINVKEINLLQISKYIIENQKGNWFFSSVLYSSYNSILLVPVLITLKKYLHNKKSIVTIAIITSIIIMIVSIFIFILLIRIDIDIVKLEMPAIYVVSKMSKLIKNIYGFIIISSIFTTSISLGTVFLQNIKKRKSYTHIAIIMCITAIGISKIGFSNLINSLYPIFGYLGLIQIIKMMIIKL